MNGWDLLIVTIRAHLSTFGAGIWTDVAQQISACIDAAVVRTVRTTRQGPSLVDLRVSETNARTQSRKKIGHLFCGETLAFIYMCKLLPDCEMYAYQTEQPRTRFFVRLSVSHLDVSIFT